MNITYLDNTFYTYVTPNDNYDCGIIFGLNNINYSNLTENKYFMFMIDKEGDLILSKVINGINIEINKKKNAEILEEFDIRNTYKLTIKYIPQIGKIISSINENIVFDILDNSFNGRFVGLKSLGNGTVFTQIIVE